MKNTSPIRLSPICHLPIRSAWQATLGSFARIKGPRAFSAATALVLAGVLSFLTCLRAGGANTTPRDTTGTVLLLSHTRS